MSFTICCSASIVPGSNLCDEMKCSSSCPLSCTTVPGCTYFPIEPSTCCDTAANVVTEPLSTVWFSAYAVGTVPTRISMIRPMPFCPSLDPCANETPVHVSTSSARM